MNGISHSSVHFGLKEDPIEKTHSCIAIALDKIAIKQKYVHCAADPFFNVITTEEKNEISEPVDGSRRSSTAFECKLLQAQMRRPRCTLEWCIRLPYLLSCIGHFGGAMNTHLLALSQRTLVRGKREIWRDSEKAISWPNAVTTSASLTKDHCSFTGFDCTTQTDANQRT